MKLNGAKVSQLWLSSKIKLVTQKRGVGVETHKKFMKKKTKQPLRWPLMRPQIC